VGGVEVSTDGGATWVVAGAFTPSASLTLGADGVYAVVVRVTDAFGNTTVSTQSVQLDTAAPTIAAALTAAPAGNNGWYDVGTTATLAYSASDGTISARLDSAIALGAPGLIDLDSLAAGAHTIVVTAVDAAGNVSTRSITFEVHATLAGLVAAVNDGAARGKITSTTQSTLVSQLKSAMSGNSAHAKLPGVITTVQQQSGKTIDAAYAALLLSWANDLYARV
ncbi:MAG TPA: hypothetical protein VIU86_05970, partial [Gaiellaceae bacterium]